MSKRMRTEADPVVYGGIPATWPETGRRVVVGAGVFGGFPAGVGRVGEAQAWTVGDMLNVSARCAPALASRRPRTRYLESLGTGTPHGMAVLGEALYFVQGGTLYRAVDEGEGVAPTVTAVGTVSDGDKQMVVFGEDLLIYPDKLYVSGADGLLHSMELETEAIAGMEFTGSTVTLPAGMSWTELGFRAGDGLHITNADDVTPAPEGDYRIRAVRGRVAYLWETFSATYTSGAVCRRCVPALTRLCVSENRVYGIAGRDIWISAVGSGFCWSGAVGGDGSGPLCMHTDTTGDLTALAPWQGYMVFYKEDRMYRMLGHRADNMSLTEVRMPGIPSELAGTLCEVGGALYYYTHSGAYRYSGGYPERLAGPLTDKIRPAITATGDFVPMAGVGGTDGVCYCLSLGARRAGGDGAGATWRQFVYVPMRDEWFAEDGFHAVAMAERWGALYAQDARGHIWLWATDGRVFPGTYTEEDDGGISSMVTFTPIRADAPDGLYLTDLYVRATGGAGAELWVDVAYGDGRSGSDASLATAETVAHVTGAMQDRLLHVPLKPRAADSLIVRLRMTGDWQIHRMVYERRA